MSARRIAVNRPYPSQLDNVIFFLHTYTAYVYCKLGHERHGIFPFRDSTGNASRVPDVFPYFGEKFNDSTDPRRPAASFVSHRL